MFNQKFFGCYFIPRASSEHNTQKNYNDLYNMPVYQFWAENY